MKRLHLFASALFFGLFYCVPAAVLAQDGQPEIAVSGNGVDIENGDGEPSVADHTDFGSAAARTFTITNSGDAELLLTCDPVVELVGSEAFSVSLQPAATTLAAEGGTQTFVVSFANTTPGEHFATVIIANNDADEDSFSFTIRGLGPVPQMVVRGNGVDILAGDLFSAEADHTEFGSTLVAGGTLTRTFTIANVGGAELTLAGTPVVEILGSEVFTVAQQPAGSTVAAGGSTGFQVVFDPDAAGRHTALVSISSDDAENPSYTFLISGFGLEQTGYEEHPPSQLVLLGSPAVFEVLVTGHPAATYQWKKGAADIRGATRASYTIPSTKAADAAAYSVVAGNGVGTPQTSNTALLGLVTPMHGTRVIKVGGALKLACTAVAPKLPGVQLRYAWTRDDGSLENGTVDGAVTTGADKASLSVTKLTTADSGFYTCVVAMDVPGLPDEEDPVLANGGIMVSVVDEAPVLDLGELPVLLSVSEPVDVRVTASNSPTSFSAKGLPAGLKFDTKTGRLYGRPTVPSRKDKLTDEYISNEITFGAANPAGPAVPEVHGVTIEALDPSIPGTYHGIVARAGHVNSGMGGHVQVTVAATGVVSGSATLAGQKHAVVGALDASLGNNDPVAHLVIKRAPASLGEIRLGLEIITGGDLMTGRITDPRLDLVAGTFDLGNPEEPGLVDGPMDEARFFSPHGLVLRADGNGYVADTGNHVVRFVDALNGLVVTHAGTGTAGSLDGARGVALFNAPEDVALDGDGNLLVADTGNATIRRVSTAGVVTTLAGSAGQAGGTNGTGSAARFSLPSALCLDPAGNLYVADRGNHTIRKITPAGVVTTLAGRAGMSGHKDGGGAVALFNTPRGITYDPVLKALFVADSLNRVIRKVTLTGAVSTYAGAPGVEGEGEGLLVNTRFIQPLDVLSRGDGTLVVADTLLVQINPNGTSGVVSSYVDGETFSDHPVALALNPESGGVLASHDTAHGIAGYQAVEEEPFLQEASFEARRNVWSAANLVPVDDRGVYNALMQTTAVPGDITFPQGRGYAQATVSRTGVVNWAGKAADGSTITFGTVLSGDYFIPLHTMLHQGTGSIQGVCFINPSTQDIVSHNTPAFDWYKLPQAQASRERGYRSGFIPHVLEVIGGKYRAGNLHEYLGLSGDEPVDMRLDFEELVPVISSFQQPFTLTAPNTVAMPAPVKSMKFKIDPKTGVFSGSYKEGTPAATVNFGGILIDYEAGGARRGEGHCLVPESSAANATLWSTPLTLDQLF